MITAVDTNVLLDVLLGDPRFGPASRAALRGAAAEGALIVSTTVAAELAAAYEQPERSVQALGRLGIELVPDDGDIAVDAGRSWRRYRRAGGTRRRILPDFLIASHAMHVADRLLSRDRGFYRSHFERLELIEP